MRFERLDLYVTDLVEGLSSKTGSVGEFLYVEICVRVYILTKGDLD